MPEIKIKDHYDQTLSFEEGLKNDLNNSSPHTWPLVLRKHIRFQVFNLFVQNGSADGAEDLKNYILRNHHAGEQLSQRDITRKLKKLEKDTPEAKKIKIIYKSAQKVSELLRKSFVQDCRKRILLTFDQKYDLMDRAMGDDFEDILLGLIKSFDHKTLAGFIRTFQLTMRGYKERHDGASFKKKQSRNRTRLNRKMWSDPKIKENMRESAKNGWKTRRQNGNAPKRLV